MKHFLLFLLLIPFIAQAQFSPQVFATAGSEDSTASGYQINFTLGESLIAYVENPQTKVSISEGFHQGLVQKCQALAFSNPAVSFPDPSFDSCETKIVLTGSIYPQFSGEWYDQDGLLLGNTPEITAAIDTGENHFTWQLSEKQCPDYDTSGQIVFRGLKADAVDDYPFQYTEFQPFLLETDTNDLNLETNFIWKMVTPPPSGFTYIDSLGKIAIKSGVFEGSIPLQYRVCNTGYCKKCDTATIFLRLQRLAGEGYNDGITPNEDGLNETFKLCDTALCNIHLQIFNRWGDLVFEQKNYQNDWAGVNNKGQPLPTGTYFYYAKFDKSERRGAVTILK
jgi:gliding motility-associated-like protein